MATQLDIPQGATPIMVIGTNRIVGQYCCPFGSPYGFGDGLDWYMYPEEVDSSDARRLGEARCD